MMLEQISCFPPILPAKPRVLILGSMPSVQSLRDNMYYANPQNAFWSILFEVCAEPFSRDFARWRAICLKYEIAVWDVLQCCVRQGSADSSISAAQANNLVDLLARTPSIQGVCYNGGAAWRYAAPQRAHISLPQYQLPSTSPAYAALSRQKKLEHWMILRKFLKVCE